MNRMNYAAYVRGFNKQLHAEIALVPNIDVYLEEFRQADLIASVAGS